MPGKLIHMIFLLLVGKLLYGQDPVYSQFYASPLYLNPALAGTGKCLRADLNYRDQWPGLTRTYVTFSASADGFIKKIRGGVGAYLMSDQAGNGLLFTNGVSVMYAHRLYLKEDFNMQFGLEAGYFQKRIDRDKLIFEDMLDPRYGLINNTATQEAIPGNPSVSFFDFSFGVIGFTEKFYAGMVVKHLTQPDKSFLGTGYSSRLPLRVTTHLGTIFYLKDRTEKSTFLSTDLLYTQQKDFKQLNLGLFYSNGTIFVGLYGRHTLANFDAIIPLLGYRNDFLKIAYSFDIPVSALSFNESRGAHEISVEILICTESKPKAGVCPRISL